MGRDTYLHRCIVTRGNFKNTCPYGGAGEATGVKIKFYDHVIIECPLSQLKIEVKTVK